MKLFTIVKHVHNEIHILILLLTQYDEIVWNLDHGIFPVILDIENCWTIDKQQTPLPCEY